MPRTARLYYPGGIFHIISRFTRREFLMCDDAHRNRYLMLLSETLKRTDALLLAWCLMSSHTSGRQVWHHYCPKHRDLQQPAIEFIRLFRHSRARGNLGLAKVGFPHSRE